MRIIWNPLKQVDHVSGWHWIDTDTGAWDGPAQDWEESHRKRIVEPLVAAGRTGVVVQAGGCQGMYPRLLARNFGIVYTLEPFPLSFRALCMNCSEAENVVALQAALGYERGTVSLENPSPVNVGEHRFRTDPDGFVPRLRIDDLGISPDLVWLDVEGGEPEVIRGMAETLDRCSPRIVCENPIKVARQLELLGYRMVDQSVSDGIFERGA